MDWARLQAHLEVIGRADTDGVRRRARYARCGCGRPVLTGLDADVAGLPVACDVVDLDRAAEAVWLVVGRPTYTVYEFATGLQLGHRNVHHIAAAAQGRPVVGAHDCAREPPPSTAWRWDTPAPAPIHAAPPF